MKELMVSAGAALLALSLAGGEVSDRPMVWAHHVPWHTPLNTGLTATGYYNFPVMDSTGNDLKDWKREIARARAQGIDGFFPDLVAHGEGAPTVFAEMLGPMLKAAEGTDFQIGMCLDVKTNVDYQVREIRRMLDLYGKHPNYPHWNGRPLVNFYTFMEWSPEELAEIRSRLKKLGYDIFIIGNIGSSYEKPDIAHFRKWLPALDMIYTFGLGEIDGTSMESKTPLYRRMADEAGKKLMMPVYPGYYGAWLNGRNDFYQVHDGLDNAHRTWLCAMEARPQWLHYTTWNDHDETSLLPMIFTPGNVPVTRAYSDVFKGKSAVTGKPEAVFAYHREELPGTLLRFEAMTLPTLKPGSTVRLSGRLLDAAGKPVAELPERVLRGDRFDRGEWLVPSASLAESPHLTPEITLRSGEFRRTFRLPELLFVTGWHQNAVTVKVASGGVLDAEGTLTVTEKDGKLHAAGSYRAPEKLSHVTLWRNDRPIANLTPAAGGRHLLNLYVTASADYTVKPENGEIIAAVRKFGENHTPGLEWDARSFTSRGNVAWTPGAILVGGTADLKLEFDVAGAEPVKISASELAERERFTYGGLTVESLPVDPTWQNTPALNRQSGSFDVTVFSREARPNDRFQLRLETADGKSGWTAPVYPFAKGNAPLPAALVETAASLETPSGATGWKGHNEYLAGSVPFRTPQLREAAVSPQSIRGGHWDFENDGRDRLGDMPVVIPESMFVPGMAGEGSALVFSGRESVRMRLRTYPVGAMTLDLLLNPDPGRTKPQGVVTRVGWSDAVELNLMPDGRLQAVRSGNGEFPRETFLSSRAIPDGRWSRVRVSCDNRTLRFHIDGSPAGEFPVALGRSYGNCTWFLGQGNKGYDNYTGKLDDLTVLGAAFAPDDPAAPRPAPARRFGPVSPAPAPAADESKSVTGYWAYPAEVEKRGGDAAAAPPSPAELKRPVLVGGSTLLLGPGPNGIAFVAGGVELAEGTMLTVPLLRFDRAEPRRDWFALLVSVANREGKSVNFNLGSDREVAISVNDPAWNARTGQFPMRLPVELKIAKRGGKLFFLLEDRVIYTADDDPAAPYTRLQVSTSSPNRADAAAIRLGPPRLAPLSE